MREIVLDTETTGLDPRTGDRIVEIGCVELVNLMPTGRVYHQYIDPERDVPEEAFAVHGLSRAFLSDFPPWRGVVDAFVAFIGDDPLVIHNAAFDMKFINAELKNHGSSPLPADRAIDTLALARKMFPGAQASLDALCRRFGVDNAMRTAHGALLDAQLLGAVYLELRGGRQPGLAMAQTARPTRGAAAAAAPSRTRAPIVRAASDAEQAAHAAILDALSAPIWRTLS